MAATHPLVLEDPWTVKASDFPAIGTVEEKLLFALNYAVLAPSILNTQPWRFRVAGETVSVHRDSTRRLPVTDPDDRETTMSCGAALFNLKIATRAFGCATHELVLPDPEDSERLADLRVTGETTPSAADVHLRDAILARRTNRGDFTDEPIPERLLGDMAVAARQEGANLTYLSGPRQAHKAAALIAEAEQIQLDDEEFRRELGRWVLDRVHEAGEYVGEARDRLAGHLPSLPPQPELSIPTAAGTARMFPNREATRAKRVAEATAPVLALLTTISDSGDQWIRAGEALQRVLLVATCAGLATSYFNTAVEVAEIRSQIGEAFHASGTPQALLRIGYTPNTIPAAPRRPVGDVLARP